MLIALYGSGLDFDRRQLDLSRPDERAALAQLSPMGKMPVLVAGDRALAESSVIIEWLAIHHLAARGLFPADPEAALPVQMWHRIADLHLAGPLPADRAPFVCPRAGRGPAVVSPVPLCRSHPGPVPLNPLAFRIRAAKARTPRKDAGR